MAKQARILSEWLPEPERILEMSEADIGLILLQFCAAIKETDRRRNVLKREYIGGPYPVKDFPSKYQGKLTQALLEAWHWLENNGYIVPEGARPNYMVSRKGERFLEKVETESRKVTIFYSWQSDLPNSTNRGFVGQCLDRAIRDLHAEGELAVDPCVDRDTQNVPGSPDIASTIFEKIDACGLFVCDVSIINKGATSRLTPNPNVLVELGYAVKTLGWNRVICVFNEASGSILDLPFDLRQRRVRSYRLEPEADKSEARTLLSRLFKADIGAILSSSDDRSATFVSRTAKSEPGFVAYLEGLSGDELYRLCMAVTDGSQSISCGRNDPTAASLVSKGLLERVPFEPDFKNMERPHTIPAEAWRYLNDNRGWLMEQAVKKNQSRSERLERLANASE
jgi:hypothetical protein